jgi:hypothetical protein
LERDFVILKGSPELNIEATTPVMPAMKVSLLTSNN